MAQPKDPNQKKFRWQPPLRNAFEHLVGDLQREGIDCDEQDVSEAAVLLLLALPQRVVVRALQGRIDYVRSLEDAVVFVRQSLLSAGEQDADIEGMKTAVDLQASPPSGKATPSKKKRA